MKSLLLLFFTALALTSVAQTMSIAETNVQIKKGDSLVKSGKAFLSEFFVMRDTASHTHATRDFTAAKVIYDNCMTNGTVADNDWGTTIASLVDGKLTLLTSYTMLYDADYRNQLMAEPEKDRSKKVTYNGTEYKVSKKTKEHFELLNPKK